MQDYSSEASDCSTTKLLFSIPCTFLLKFITNLIHPRQNLFVQEQHKHVLPGVSFQLHSFRAALIPFPAPDKIHSCASSQYLPVFWSVPDPLGSQEGLSMPCPTSCCSLAIPKLSPLLCPTAQPWEHCWQTSHCWAQHMAPHKYFQL